MGTDRERGVAQRRSSGGGNGSSPWRALQQCKLWKFGTTYLHNTCYEDTRVLVIIIDPEDYSACASELLVLAAIFSWIVTLIFNQKVIADNPLKDRLGYNNICVGWDDPPAIFIAAPILIFGVYMMIRYSYLDQLRCNLTKGLDTKRKFTSFLANVSLAVSYIGVAMLFVVSPNRSPEAHTGLFMNLILWTYWSRAANFYEAERRHWVPGSQLYMMIFAVDSIGFVLVLAVQLVAFDPVTKERGPIPWYVCALFDYAWFICLALSGNFMPHAPSIRFEARHHSDDDFIVEDHPDVTPVNTRIVAPAPQGFGASES